MMMTMTRRGWLTIADHCETAIVGHSGRDEQNEVLHVGTISYRLSEHSRPRVPQTYSVTPHSSADVHPATVHLHMTY